jgi:hypothetical protein
MSLKPFTAEGRFECGFNELVHGKLCALVAVWHSDVAMPGAWVSPLRTSRATTRFPSHWVHGDDVNEMHDHAEALNAELFGLSRAATAQIILSSMRGSRSIERRPVQLCSTEGCDLPALDQGRGPSVCAKHDPGR